MRVKRWLVSLLPLLASIGPTRLHGQAVHSPEIITTASAKRALPPDQANVRVGVEVHAATAAAASAQLAEKLADVRGALKRFATPLDSIEVIAFNVGPNWSFGGGRSLIDYQGSAVIGVSLRAIGSLGSLVDTIFASGATEIPSITFTSDTATAVRLALLAEAMAHARADALALAMASGGRLGQVVQVSTSAADDDEIYLRPRGGQFVGNSFEDAGTAFPGFRSVIVRVDVRATWQLRPHSP